ncbi:unnamed protein product [Brassica napus]|uniref:(rape) hypothetical protein n=1 Tax=Brassica napus TaxID=3708 RepID=A0A816Q0A3_BRANA|nr:unnamed protein product [Brassica napus]
MRKAVLLSKRTSARSQDSDAPPRTHVLRHTRAKKKGAYYLNPIISVEYIHLQITIAVIKFKILICNAQRIIQTMVPSNKEGLTQSFYPVMPGYFFLMVHIATSVLQKT